MKPSLLSDKDIFGKHTKVLYYSGYFELLDFNEFEQVLKERDEQRVCKNCKHQPLCSENVMFALGSNAKKIEYCSLFEEAKNE